jgi:hypothetical protein
MKKLILNIKYQAIFFEKKFVLSKSHSKIHPFVNNNYRIEIKKLFEDFIKEMKILF